MSRTAGSKMLCLLLLLALTGPGCVRRRLTVRTTPPGAQVFIDDQEIGFTPVSTSFVYYGTRKIQLVKDGFETLTVRQTFNPPWYELPPLDFINETLNPQEIRDERALDFQLLPAQIVSQNDLLLRAEGLRGSSQQGQAIPMIIPGLNAPASAIPTGRLPPTSNLR